MTRRTDLAIEEKELWEQSASQTTQMKGIKALEQVVDGITITEVDILDEVGAKQLNKPIGKYLTIDLDVLKNKEAECFTRTVTVLSDQLKKMANLKPKDTVLIVGLGNCAITPDAIGPKTLEHLLITRHLVDSVPDYFGNHRQVSALAPGVLGITGIESAEVIYGIAQRIKPSCILVIDALASSSLTRVCNTVQLADTGITPGSGIQNARASFTKEKFGVPVIAIGVPTVVSLGTLAAEYGERTYSEAEISKACGNQYMIVTPRDIDAKIEQLAKVLGYCINLALHQQMTLDDISYFVE